MDVRTARKIAQDVGNVQFTNQERRQAFWALDTSAFKSKDPVKSRDDRILAKVIWDFFGNLGVEGKETN